MLKNRYFILLFGTLKLNNIMFLGCGDDVERGGSEETFSYSIYYRYMYIQYICICLPFLIKNDKIIKEKKEIPNVFTERILATFVLYQRYMYDDRSNGSFIWFLCRNSTRSFWMIFSNHHYRVGLSHMIYTKL